MDEFWSILIVLAVIIVSMVLHEMAHGYVAYFLGDTTAKEEGRLSLNPLVHLDPVTSVLLPLILFVMKAPVFGGAKPVPISPERLKGGAWGMALVAIAGPLVNFILALTFFIIGMKTNLIGFHNGLIYYTGYEGLAMAEMVMVNLGFMVFNLIPVPPLDGSRVLYAIAPDGVRDFMDRMERSTGIMLVFVLIMIFGTVFSAIMSGAIDGILKFFDMLV